MTHGTSVVHGKSVSDLGEMHSVSSLQNFLFETLGDEKWIGTPNHDSYTMIFEKPRLYPKTSRFHFRPMTENAAVLSEQTAELSQCHMVMFCKSSSSSSPNTLFFFAF